MNKVKEIREKKANTKFLRGSAKPAYVHASKQTEFEDSTIQNLTIQDFKKFTINFEGVNQLLQLEMISYLLHQVFLHTYNHSILLLK